MDDTEMKFMRVAIEEAKKSVAEDTRPHPKVGVVVVKNGTVMATAFRGEVAGNHAEFIAIDNKLKDETLAGATVYTTLEPCTTRNHPKIPCAKRLIDRKVARVVIGMLDPNPQIMGKGQQKLREFNIATDLFPAPLMAELEDLNREFLRHYRTDTETQADDESAVIRGRSLDEWYRVINSIYWNLNLHRDRFAIFAHLSEVIGGLSLLASQKRKHGLIPESFVSKAVAWWMALCGKVGVKSVAEMVWAKFPYLCPYCKRCAHDPDACSEVKQARAPLDWKLLERTGAEQLSRQPKTLGDWQRMFSTIYPALDTEAYGSTFARCTEEFGEIAEALRVFPEAPDYFLSEAADVFAWLMHIRNLIDVRHGTPLKNRGDDLEGEFSRAYPDKCLECGKAVCSCPLILRSTIGRIAHELPGGREHFMTPDKVQLLFQPKDRH